MTPFLFSFSNDVCGQAGILPPYSVPLHLPVHSLLRRQNSLQAVPDGAFFLPKLAFATQPACSSPCGLLTWYVGKPSLVTL